MHASVVACPKGDCVQQHMLDTRSRVCARAHISWVFSALDYFTVLLQQLQPLCKTLEIPHFFSDSAIRHGT